MSASLVVSIDATISRSGGDVISATSTAPAGATPCDGAPHLHAPRREQLGELRRRVERRVGRGTPRAERLVAVVHRERAERADVAVGEVARRPPAHGALLVVARVVADHAVAAPGGCRRSTIVSASTSSEVTTPLLRRGWDSRLATKSLDAITGSPLPTSTSWSTVPSLGRGRRHDLRLVGEVGPEHLERRRGDEQLLRRRGDERRVDVRRRDERAVVLDHDAHAGAADLLVERALQVLRADRVGERLGRPARATTSAWRPPAPARRRRRSGRR